MTGFALSPYFRRHNNHLITDDSIFDWNWRNWNNLVKNTIFNADLLSSLHETAEGYELRMDLPGIKQENLKVELDDQTLSITAERKEETKQKGATELVNERTFGSYTRQFYLTSPVNPDTVTASLKDGVLTVKLAKKGEAKGKTISVTT